MCLLYYVEVCNCLDMFEVGQQGRHLQHFVFFPLLAFNSWKEGTSGSILSMFAKTQHDLVS